MIGLKIVLKRHTTAWIGIDIDSGFTIQMFKVEIDYSGLSGQPDRYRNAIKQGDTI